MNGEGKQNWRFVNKNINLTSIENLAEGVGNRLFFFHHQKKFLVERKKSEEKFFFRHQNCVRFWILSVFRGGMGVGIFGGDVMLVGNKWDYFWLSPSPFILLPLEYSSLGLKFYGKNTCVWEKSFRVFDDNRFTFKIWYPSWRSYLKEELQKKEGLTMKNSNFLLSF